MITSEQLAGIKGLLVPALEKAQALERELWDTARHGVTHEIVQRVCRELRNAVVDLETEVEVCEREERLAR